MTRSKRRRPSIAVARTGTSISYTDSEASTSTFTVLKPTRGARRGHRCVRRSKSLRHAKACTRYVPKGSFTHADQADRNTIHFTGRVHRHALRPGGYRMSVRATTAGKTGAPRTAKFRIVR